MTVDFNFGKACVFKQGFQRFSRVKIHAVNDPGKLYGCLIRAGRFVRDCENAAAFQNAANLRKRLLNILPEIDRF
ncbi:MAG: hypothetical protein IKD72_09805, partial [Clostridia bacterium]|nr:hypothetical protein [Clostridia bacterium]